MFIGLRKLLESEATSFATSFLIVDIYLLQRLESVFVRLFFLRSI